MSAHAAVGIDDDFASGESAVANGAADDEFAGGVDVVVDFSVDVFFGEDGFDDFVDDFSSPSTSNPPTSHKA